MPNLAAPKDVLSELYDPDESVRKEFQNHIAAETIAFSETFAATFVVFEKLYQDFDGSLQRSFVGGFVHGVLDDLLTSVKLLLTGKLGASGNLARQAAEGICISVLCCHDGPLSFKKEECNYWELVRDEDPRADGNRAPWQLLSNVEKLGLNNQGVEQLKAAVESHHPHSHAGRLAMANRMQLAADGKMYFGGHFDIAKLEGYKAEMAQRISLCKWAYEIIEALSPQLKKLPTGTQYFAD